MNRPVVIIREDGSIVLGRAEFAPGAATAGVLASAVAALGLSGATARALSAVLSEIRETRAAAPAGR